MNKYKLFLIAALATLSGVANAQNYNAIHASKEVNPNDDGSYTLTLETFVEGEYSSESTSVKTTNPVDFVLCLELSNSMLQPLVNSNKVAYINAWSTKINENVTLDKVKGAREGYYACKETGAFGLVSDYKDLRWYSNKWQYREGDEWKDLQPSGINLQAVWSWWANVEIYKSKLGALMDACDAFIDKIASSQTDGSLNGSNGHKVGVVSFAAEAKEVLGLTSINSKTAIKDAIHALGKDAGGAGAADYGLTAAKKMLNLNTGGNGRSKALLLFTDGQPNHGSGFSTTVANDAINIAKGIKSANAKIFTINVYEQTKENDNMWKYMNYVSSNYPTASKLTSPGTKDSDQYYHMATNENALNAAFVSSVNVSITQSGGASVDLLVSQVTLRDAVTSSFILPDGASSVRVYEVPVSETVPSSHLIGDIGFKTVSEAEKVTPAGVYYTVENNIVDVAGYDFSSKWVGYKINKKNGSTTYTINPLGAKLVIEITIVPNPNDEGGYVKTNEDISGIYVGDTQITENKKKPYITPDPVFTPMDLKIQKSGLKPGESVLYTITRTGDSDFSMNVILTADEDGEASTTVAKVPVKDASGHFYEYVVTEDNSWDWAYQATTQPVKHTLGTLDTANKTFSKNNTFVVPASSSSTAGTSVIHAEDYKTNKFAK